MFGYVLPDKPELKMREYNIFNAYYCRLCKTIGTKSQVSRLTLTYDMTFLALLLSALYNDEEIITRKRCMAKLKMVPVVKNSEFIEYAADMNILLANRKLKDSFNDDKNVFAYFASLFIRSKTYGQEKLTSIDKYLSNISKLEKEKCSNIDQISDQFAMLTSEIFSYKQDSNALILQNMGYNLGKWIYIIDAFDDIEKDIKKGSYNPFIYGFGYNNSQTCSEFKKNISENAEFTLIKCLDEVSKAFELLDFKKNKEILDNIIYLGLEKKTTQVIRGGQCNEKPI